MIDDSAKHFTRPRSLHASRFRPPRPRPGLLVSLDPLRVRIVSGDLLEQRELEALAELVSHVLEHALSRQAGAA